MEATGRERTPKIKGEKRNGLSERAGSDQNGFREVLDYLKFLADMEKEGKMTEFFKGEQYICLETLDMFRLWPGAKEFLPDDLEARFPL